MSRRVVVLLVAVFAIAALGSCANDEPTDVAASPSSSASATSASSSEALRVVSTTSIVDTGLADGLAERFLDEKGIKMEINGVGSGQAFTLGRDGEADLVLAHDPDAQAAFEKDGFVEESREFARNDFVLVGPPSDPAGVASAASLADAFKLIAEKEVSFISRGDKSGTNTRELKIWDASGAEHEEDWYVTTGQGMGETLRVASEKEAYTLSDTATFRTAVKGDDLKILVDKGPMRDNIYVANVVRFDGKVSEDAKTFLAWLAEPSTVDYILNFGKDEYGEPLFKAV